MLRKAGLLGLAPGGQLRQVAEVLQRPVRESPVGGQGQRADGDRQQRRAADRAAKQVADGRGAARPARALAACHSSDSGTLRTIHSTETGRQHADEEDGAARPIRAWPGDEREGHRGEHRQQRAAVDGGLQDGGDPRSPAAGPGFREQRRAHRPFAADSQRRQEAADQQVPPGLREERQAGEQRVGEDRQHQRPRPPQPVAEAAEPSAPQRPADAGTRPGSASRNSPPRRRAGRPRRAVGRRRAWPRACTGACPGRRTASRARRRSPISTVAG